MYIPEISNDGKFLIISTNKDTANMNLLAVADISDGISRSFTRSDIMIRNLVPDFIGSFSYLHNKDYDFYFVTNFDAPNKRIIKIDSNYPEQYRWVEIVPQHGNDLLEYSFISNGYIMINYL